MKIISDSTVVVSQPLAEKMQALKMELASLKEEVASLRAEAVKPTPVKQEEPLAPVVLRSTQDPLFAQLWAYVNNEK